MKSTTDIVKEKYGETARVGLSSDDASVRAVAQAFGYSAEELASIPAEANMGLSCGNPLATAHLKEGEVVVDLGSWRGSRRLPGRSPSWPHRPSHRHRHDSPDARARARQRRERRL